MCVWRRGEGCVSEAQTLLSNGSSFTIFCRQRNGAGRTVVPSPSVNVYGSDGKMIHAAGDKLCQCTRHGQWQRLDDAKLLPQRWRVWYVTTVLVREKLVRVDLRTAFWDRHVPRKHNTVRYARDGDIRRRGR